MIIKSILKWTFLMLLVINVQAQTEIDNYQVEILIFKQLVQDPNAENFEEEIIIANTDEAFQLTQHDIIAKSEEAEPLKIENFSLNNEQNDFGISLPNMELVKLNTIKASLKRSSRFHVIKHIAWQLPGLDNENAKKVRITDGKPFVIIKDTLDETIKNIAVDYETLLITWDKFKKQQSKTIDIKKNNNTEQDEPKTISIPSDLITYLKDEGKLAYIAYPLDGTIRVVRTRYLHMYLNLVWTVEVAKKVEPEQQATTKEAISDDDNELSELTLLSLLDKSIKHEHDKPEETLLSLIEPLNLQSFSFNAHRKMRSKHQHYIDHPKLGLISIITPINKPEPIVVPESPK